MRKLFKEFNQNQSKFIYFNKKYKSLEILEKIKTLSKKIKLNNKGLVSIDTRNKIDFIIKFYALNKAGFSVLINDNNNKKKILKEKININYYFKNQKLIKLNSVKFKNQKRNSIILKTSGSTDFNKYVFLSDEKISYISKMMNEETNIKNLAVNELIYSPLNHAFAFGRLHSLIKSNNSITIPNNLSISNFFETLLKEDNINAVSITAGFFTKILKLKSSKLKKIFKKIIYIQISSGHFPVNLRKKLLNSGVNLFINYGMTEAMRTTFLNCKKNPKKIHTEGKPFPGINIKILKNKDTNDGEILVKGKNLANTYSNQEEWNKRNTNGWFRTGDIGKLDKDNYLIYHKRIDDNLNINDINFSKNYLENLIKKKFKISNIKILHTDNIKKKLYLFIDKKIQKKKIFKFLKLKKIFLPFDKIIFIKNTDLIPLGKWSLNYLLKQIK